MLDNLTLPQNAVVFLPADQIMQMFDSVLCNRLKEKHEVELQNKELSKEETAKLLGVSEGTIDNWSKAGILTKHFRGRLTYFVYSEITDSKSTLKRYSRKQMAEA